MHHRNWLVTFLRLVTRREEIKTKVEEEEDYCMHVHRGFAPHFAEPHITDVKTK